MAPDESPPDGRTRWRPRWLRRKRWRALVSLFALALLAIIFAYSKRESIADNIIAAELDARGIPATYDVASIAPGRQVLRNVVIGDPERPDLTIDQIEVYPRYRFGTPAIGRIRLVRPRLSGTWRDGKLSFGTLDPLLLADSGAEPGLPDLDLALVDGRARILTDYGAIGLVADGEGELDDGFVGRMALSGPRLDIGECNLAGTRASGAIEVRAGRPRFSGPFALRSLSCEEPGRAAVQDLAGTLFVLASEDFAEWEGRAEFEAGPARYADMRAGAGSGGVRFDWSEDFFALRHDVRLEGFVHPQARLGGISSVGALRLRAGRERIDWQAEFSGENLRPGPGLAAALRDGRDAGRGTLAAPLLSRMLGALEANAPGSRAVADVTLRKNGDTLLVSLPRARWTNRSGDTLLSLTQARYTYDGEGPARWSGSLSTGGPGLPRLAGRVAREGDGTATMRLAMSDYGVGANRLAIPELVARQRAGGAVGFAGRVLASGDVPGGRVQALELSLQGSWRPNGALQLWPRCTQLRFAAFELAGLALDRGGLRICPEARPAILTLAEGEARYGLQIPAATLVGTLGGAPAKLSSGPVTVRTGGRVEADGLDVVLGEDESAARFVISELTAELSGEMRGDFEGADITLDAVPLDLVETSGTWRYVDGELLLSDGAFRLLDREEDDRFEPLEARGAALRLADSIMTAQAALRHPQSGRLVTDVAIRHDLSTGRGHADLAVPGLVFDAGLQPEDLTYLAKGVVALAQGTVTGTGRIDWNEGGVSSTGRFSSENLDFAAAFGPVKGASGTVVFDDLLGLTTAPDQQISVASVNPGIEVFDGTVRFALREGQFLSVEGGTWPFMGGTLTLRPVDLNLGESEERRYVIEIVGADAAQFVASFEIGNISATGTFDGTVPILFDENGDGRIEGGLLVSRPPGGNISYVGELTYEDLGAMGNFAFQSLRSLDFNQMMVEMDGPLTGEIVTRLRFDGVRQGEGASSNFVTRQIAKLPIRFIVNIRAPFYQLITSIRGMYDPALTKDPREVGLLAPDGSRAQPQTNDISQPARREDETGDEPPIQMQESEDMP